jgi:low temperature requirement protein LtrA
MTPFEKAKSILLGIWWISWFGIITGFVIVGVWEYRNIPPKVGTPLHFFLSFLIVTILLWVVFYVACEKAWAKVDGAKNYQVIADLLTMAGTFLAIVTIMGILFFLYIAPRVQ